MLMNVESKVGFNLPTNWSKEMLKTIKKRKNASFRKTPHKNGHLSKTDSSLFFIPPTSSKFFEISWSNASSRTSGGSWRTCFRGRTQSRSAPNIYCKMNRQSTELISLLIIQLLLMLEDVYASSDVNIVMMMFFELFYSEKCPTSNYNLRSAIWVLIAQWLERLTGDQKVVGSSPVWELRNFSE